MKHYKQLEIVKHEVHGLAWAMEAMRLPKGSTGDSTRPRWTPQDVGPKDLSLASRLVKAGPDHAKAMRGIVVWLQIKCQVGWLIEFETYRHGVECLSTSSSMHQELKQLTGEELAEQKQADLPDKVYTRSLTISYQALRSMYRARRNHKHPDWRILCDWIETLPCAAELITPPSRMEEKLAELRSRVAELEEENAQLKGGQ